MDFITAEALTALAQIVMIDLVLAGDNAIVIALAARNLPKHLQKKAVVWGTVGAIVVRTLMTLVVVWLLKIPGLLLVGGLALLWIAYRLLTAGEGGHDEHGGTVTFAAALKTIIIADAVMGVDNVLAVAGAAHGNFLLVILGLLISVPIMVWGSRLILALLGKYPQIMYIGAGVLVITSVKMVSGEPLVAPYVAANPWIVWVAYPLALIGVLGGARMVNQARTAKPLSHSPSEAV